FHRVPFIYNVQEIYPDILIRMGVIRNAGLIGTLYKLEKFIYRCANRITIIAPNMAARLRQKGVPADKIAIIPNFVDTDFFRPLDKENDFSRKYNLPDQFVVSYAGNMGPAQGLEHFVEAANLLRNESHISFLMMGDGILRADLARRAQQLRLPNFIFLPYQPYALMPQIYAASDLSLVPLVPETGGDALPSKVYRIMACRRALLVAADHDSDLAALVRDVDCGILVEPGAPRALADAIREAARRPDYLKEMGRKAYNYALKYYARPVITGQYDLLIRSMICYERNQAQT
ncbi:MAG: glycosyltransferase family 4 protein, partial [Kiritimatiellae bacterium]|nr:glycosyltransferase family 4 protein [Kiritimatiellia bacterium]